MRGKGVGGEVGDSTRIFLLGCKMNVTSAGVFLENGRQRTFSSSSTSGAVERRRLDSDKEATGALLAEAGEETLSSKERVSIDL